MLNMDIVKLLLTKDKSLDQKESYEAIKALLKNKEVDLDVQFKALCSKFSTAYQNAIYLSLGAGYINDDTIDFIIRKGFQNIASIAVSIDYKIKQVCIQPSMPSHKQLQRKNKEKHDRANKELIMYGGDLFC